MRHPVRNTILVATLFLLQLGGSCVSDNTGPNNGQSNSNGNYDPNYDSNGNSNAGPTYDANNQNVANNYERPRRIPRNADIVREGTGNLKWTADLDGTLFVYDRDKDVIRYTGPIQRGQEVVIKPASDKVYVAAVAVPISEQNLQHDSCHQIFFSPNGHDSHGGNYDLNQYHDRDHDHGYDSRPPDAAGDPVPPNCERMSGGYETIEITNAPRTATVYIYDETSQKILFHTTLKKGATMQVIPRDGVILVNGKPLSKMRFPGGHTLTLYLQTK